MSKQVRKLFAQLRKEQKEVEKKIENLVEEAAFNGNRYAVQNIRKEEARAFGKLMQSIGVQRITPKNYEVVASMPYAPFVEFGTGGKVDVPKGWEKIAIEFKGKKVGNFEKALQSIKDWCKKKGIDEGLAYPILMTILKDGQRPRPFMIPAYNRTTAELTEKLKKYVR